MDPSRHGPKAISCRGHIRSVLIFGPPLALQGLRANEILPVIESTLKQMLADLRAGNLGKYK
jgi:hypothetical protein